MTITAAEAAQILGRLTKDDELVSSLRDQSTRLLKAAGRLRKNARSDDPGPGLLAELGFKVGSAADQLEKVRLKAKAAVPTTRGTWTGPGRVKSINGLATQSTKSRPAHSPGPKAIQSNEPRPSPAPTTKGAKDMPNELVRVGRRYTQADHDNRDAERERRELEATLSRQEQQRRERTEDRLRDLRAGLPTPREIEAERLLRHYDKVRRGRWAAELAEQESWSVDQGGVEGRRGGHPHGGADSARAARGRG